MSIVLHIAAVLIVAIGSGVAVRFIVNSVTAPIPGPANWNPRSSDDGLMATRVVVHDVALTDDEIRLIRAAQHRADYDDLLDTCADESVAVATLLDRLATTLDQPNGGAAA